MKYRRFTQDFKRSLIEQLLSETVTPLEICTHYHISSGQLHPWKRHYAQGKLDPEPSKAVKHNLKQAEKKESSLPKIAPLSKAFKGGVN